MMGPQGRLKISWKAWYQRQESRHLFSLYDHARLWWVLAYYGFSSKMNLDGGLTAIGKGYPVEIIEPRNR
jgi:hypothetical protein